MWNLLDSRPQEFRAGQGSMGSTRHRRGRERERGRADPGCRKGRVRSGWGSLYLGEFPCRALALHCLSENIVIV